MKTLKCPYSKKNCPYYNERDSVLDIQCLECCPHYTDTRKLIDFTKIINIIIKLF